MLLVNLSSLYLSLCEIKEKIVLLSLLLLQRAYMVVFMKDFILQNKDKCKIYLLLQNIGFSPEDNGPFETSSVPIWPHHRENRSIDYRSYSIERRNPYSRFRNIDFERE